MIDGIAAYKITYMYIFQIDVQSIKIVLAKRLDCQEFNDQTTHTWMINFI